jgi:RHS repeat-associated protein
MTSPKGETTTIKRGSHGNPEVIERPAPGGRKQITKHKYNSLGELESLTDPLERTWKYEYDTYGDRVAEVDPASDRRTWKYNGDSQEIATVSPRGNIKAGEESKYTIKTARDAQGRPLTITNPLGHTTKYSYDGDGNVESITDGNAHTTTYTYNGDNEQTKAEEPNKTITETGYDGAGQIIAQTSGGKHTTKYGRNALEQAVKTIDALGRMTTKEYDKAGNLTKVTDAENRTTTYTYDHANRLTEVVYSSGNPATIKYEYDKDGERTKMTDGTGTTTYAYDQLDRLTRSENGHKESIEYEYDLANEQTKLTYPNGNEAKRSYDKDGRLEKVTDWLENTTQFAYNANSELNRTTFPASTEDVDKYEYNQADQMSSQTMARGTTKLASYGYGHDNDNQVNAITNHNGEAGAEKTAYEYDANNRLTKVAGATVYEYNADNDPTKINSGAYSYNAADELEKGAGVTYAYNEEGQRTKTTPEKGPAATYGYNQAGELTSVERPEGEGSPKIEDAYAYNGEGLRASQTISGTTSNFAWNATEGVPLVLSDGTNSYIYGPGGIPLEQINNSQGKALYLHHDQQGSTRLLTNSTGKVEGGCSYSPYGTSTCEGAATTPLGFDGQYTNSDTGLIYLRAREYDPSTAQFLSVDPAEPITRAPYTYASDNPLNHSDPTGLGEWEPWTESFWTEENFISNSPLNPIPYYEEEIESYENGCPYLTAVAHGLEGAVAGAALFAGGEGADEADITVADVLKGKLGKITRAPLPPGSPSWADIQQMTIAEIRAAAKANEPGYRTILKLLTEGKYNKP